MICFRPSGGLEHPWPVGLGLAGSPSARSGSIAGWAHDEDPQDGIRNIVLKALRKPARLRGGDNAASGAGKECENPLSMPR